MVAAQQNLLIDPALTGAQRRIVEAAIPRAARHRWFRSMRSSQALVQSVFGHLLAANALDSIRQVQCDLGFQPFANCGSGGSNLCLECNVTYLGEPRPTSMDIFIDGVPRVSVECKMSEQDVGNCSRPRLPPTHVEFCNGNYQLQQGRTTPCALSAIGVRYWDFVPRLFSWNVGTPPIACPLHRTYQLVRNVLAACVDSSGNLVDGIAVLMFDNRNPAWLVGGKGHTAFQQVRQSLREPHRLQMCSWQDLLAVMRRTQAHAWLTNEIQLKYGM